MADDMTDYDAGLIDVSEISLQELDHINGSALARELLRFLHPEAHDIEPVASFNSYMGEEARGRRADSA